MINIAYAVDANYLRHAAASMQSVANHHPTERIAFWILTNGVIRDDEWHGAFGGILTALDVRRVNSEKNFSRLGVSHHHEVTYVSDAMYLRLEIPHIIPADITRVLYLDADVICTSRGLESLFTIDLGENVLGAVRDPVTARICDDNGIPFLERYPELDPLALYFNSGVLLIDTKRYRDAAVRDRCVDYLEETAVLRRYPDQDALNVACYGFWLRLNKRWNHMRSERLDTNRADNLDQACLIHVSNKIKPWHSDFPDCRRKRLYEALRTQIDASMQQEISST